MKILVADSVPDNVIAILKADPSWDVVNLPKTKGNVAEEIRDADALLVRSATKVTSSVGACDANGNSCAPPPHR